MNELSCNRADELAPAAVLGADPELTGAVARHLATCPEDHAETRELLAAVDALPSAVLPVEPRPQLRERLMATIAETPQGVGAVAPPSQAAAAPGTARDGWLDWLRPGLARGIAVAAVAAVLVLAVLAVQLGSQLSARDATLQAVAQALSRGNQVHTVEGSAGTAYLVQDDAGHATLLGAGLQAPPAGRLYEMWLIDAGGAAVPAGTFVPQEADISVAKVSRPVGDAETFAVTIEQHAVDQPTSDPVLVATFAQ
jgi:anti-sigma-K factor RskA